MASLPKSTIKMMTSKINKIQYFPDTAKEKSQRDETISVGPLLPSADHVN
jgi:hypothetical protein